MAYQENAIRSVLSELVLEVVAGVDGRSVSDFDKGRLAMLAAVADRLGMSQDAEQLRRIVNVANKGYVRDLETAAQKILSTFV